MMRIKLSFNRGDYKRFKDLLYTCAECDDFFIVDHEIAEAVLKQLEDVDY